MIGFFKARLDVVELLWLISYLRLRLSSCSGSVFKPFKVNFSISPLFQRRERYIRILGLVKIALALKADKGA